jgi:hypothetical protein
MNVCGMDPARERQDLNPWVWAVSFKRITEAPNV